MLAEWSKALFLWLRFFRLIPGSNRGSDSMLFDLCLHQYSTIKSIYISFQLQFSSVTLAEWSKALYLVLDFSGRGNDPGFESWL